MAGDASIPKTDRELLLKLNGEIKNLAESIYNFGEVLKTFEEKRIVAVEKRLDKIEGVWQQVSGAWKLGIILWSILTAGGLIGWALMAL